MGDLVGIGGRFDLEQVVLAAVAVVVDGVGVLDHAGKPPVAAGTVEPWASHIAELATLPNTW